MFKELLAGLADHLAKRGVPYMIIGGQAVLLYGEPRLTRDIDITVGFGPERAAEIVAVAKELGLRHLVPDPLQFARETFVLPCLEESSGIRVDFIFSYSVYEKEAIARARAVEIHGVKVNYATLEDVIIHKVIAGRPRDLEDARIMLLKNPLCNRDFIRACLREFDMPMSTDFVVTFDALCREADGEN